ncbi:MAG: hypothetical protein GWP66_02770 [Gammaproteobacteria bacterium]|jgi:hypothetical protein|nr:hypothetical protein [Gammaproteobacteria bacterium]
MRYLILLLVLGLPAGALAAAKSEEANLAERVATAAFTAAEKSVIEEFFGRPATTDEESGEAKEAKEAKSGKGGKSKKMPKGLAKRDSLPPGLERQLEKNGTLPPGLAKRDLPADLTRRLPKRDDGTERVIVDSDVVLVEAATGVVLDILRGVAGTDR